MFGRLMERIKEGEYGQCTLYTCMKLEQWNVEIVLRREIRGMRENDGDGESS
jgi:hypothetical protein